MIRDRLWLSPLWVQGLVQVATFVVFIGAMVVVLYPMFIARVGWPLSVLAVVALCAIVSGATLYLQRPVRQRGLDALGGGTQADRLAALAALRTGEVPADADVLAAAIRYGAVVRACQADTSRTQRAIQWLGPVVAIVYGVFGLFRLPLRFGAVLIAVGIWWAVLSVLRARRRRRTFQNLGALRAAAGPEPSSTGEDDAVAGLPPSRHRLAAAVALIAVAAFMTLVYFVVRSDPDCYYVADAANLIYDQRQLTDPQNMTRGQPDLETYRRWAQHLRTDADHVTDPRLAPRLRHIAELADQAATQFAQSRDALVRPPPGYDLHAQQTAFGATMRMLIDEDNAVFAVCFPHR